jgi:radical SAM superfamily enzyme YgiQ (UPF0313 family)
MNIGLISPKRGQLIENKEFDEFFWSSYELSTRAEIIYRWPELGLLTLASLMPKEYNIRYIDDAIEHIDYDEPFDIVGITALTPKAHRAYEIAQEFRARGVCVIMGGPHASVMVEETLQHVDVVFIGEAQNSWGAFIDDYLSDKVKRTYGTLNNLARMEDSPIPRYDLLNVENYRIIPIETTRGCPHDCEFCSSTRLWGNKYRKKSLKQVLDEIAVIKKVAPRKYLFFVDDNMFVDREYSSALLESIIPFNVRWFTQTDISIADDDSFLDLMYRAGCREVLIGFETLSPQNMQMVDNKNWKLKQLGKYGWAIQKIQSHGIAIYGSFILGMDHDDETVFPTLRDFIVKTNLLGFQILIMTPIPGTRLYQRLSNEDRLLTGKNWGNYSTYQLNFKLKQMSQETFEKGIIWLFKELYNDNEFKRRRNHHIKLIRSLSN